MIKNKIAEFEKVSYAQFQSDYVNIFGEGRTLDMTKVKEIYDGIKIPCRKTKFSAGHDISIPYEITLGNQTRIEIIKHSSSY